MAHLHYSVKANTQIFRTAIGLMLEY